jgi:DNA-binding HxlR family transcriptional regulator
MEKLTIKEAATLRVLPDSVSGLAQALPGPAMHILCPIRYSLDIVGGKWKLAIICALADESPTRYGVIRKKLAGITNMMLSQSLKELEVYGIVHRRQYNEIPPRVEYTLSEKGKSLMPALRLLAQWGEAHMTEDRCGTAGCEACRP